MDLNEAYSFCQSVINRHSSTFSAAFSTLPFDDRRAVWAVYAFCRCVDDIVDEGTQSIQERLKLLDDFAWNFQHFQGENLSSKSPLWLALADVFSRYGMIQQPFEDMIKGQRDDLLFKQPVTMDELESYCYDVAGTVGLMLLPILHPRYTPSMKKYVVSLGIAMQLTNILRDVSEDEKRDRIYIPTDCMEQYKVSREDIHHGIYTEGWYSLAAKIAERAESLYQEAIEIAGFFPPESQRSLLAATHLYRAILQKIISSHYEVFFVRHYVDRATRHLILNQIQLKNATPIQDSWNQRLAAPASEQV